MKRNLLDELNRKSISADDAQKIFDAVLDAGEMRLGEGVGMSRAEYTAYGHGVPLAELSRWRKDGWPDVCVACRQRIEIPRFGWIAKEPSAGGDHFLKHLECPKI